MRYDVPLDDWLVAHHRRVVADIVAELAPAEPGRWWFPVDRAGGVAVDRLCEPMHAVAAWTLDLAEPRFERPRGRRRIAWNRTKPPGGSE